MFFEVQVSIINIVKKSNFMLKLPYIFLKQSSILRELNLEISIFKNEIYPISKLLKALPKFNEILLS